MRLEFPGHSGDLSLRFVGVCKFRSYPTHGPRDFSIGGHVGSGLPGPAETDHSALAAVSEFLLAKEAGPIDDGYVAAQIGEVLLGRIRGRRPAQEVILYESLGLIVQDLAAVTYPHSPASAARGTS